MCALTISSDDIRPDRIAFAIHVADAPMTFLRRRRFLGISDRVAGLDVENLYPRADQLLQSGGPADQRWERAEMHRHDRLDAEEGHGLGRALRAHRVKVADREECHVELA